MSRDMCPRPIRDSDWPDVAALEADAYAGSSLAEGRAVLESRGRAAPATCFVLDLDGRVAGYVLALPYPMFQYPDLARAERPAVPSRNLHLHDMVVARDQRGRGRGSGLLSHLTRTAGTAGYDHISLVAVEGKATFWASRGFLAHQGVAVPPDYGDNAVYMSRALTGVRISGATKADRFPCPVP
ncbi:GNAT superfamily N-acetyltransferase [Streptomyces aurantiacus]|uniref:GNAT family N-acetyltransferase n=1 Tax=Streptomyces aurantiacus TaxID=47760 RepID=UPI002791C855|nr:GNAT family N-acetyltransferase [Streptomyces aurantiacus]MDQ0771819.1 GNAT superfamily N-acetyltransferase [Streptomyces aurantiacus]